MYCSVYIFTFKYSALPEANGIGADGETAAGSPDALLTDLGASVGGVDHGAGLDKDTNVLNSSVAVAALAPEDQVTRLGLGTGNVLAHGGVVLRLSSARDGLALSLADGVLGEAYTNFWLADICSSG